MTTWRVTLRVDGAEDRVVDTQAFSLDLEEGALVFRGVAHPSLPKITLAFAPGEWRSVEKLP